MASDLTLAPAASVSSETSHASESNRRERHASVAHSAADEREHQLAVQAAREKFVDRVSKASGLERGRLVIEKDDETGRFVHKLIDPKSGEVVRQWPDESWLEFAKAHSAPHGLWVDTQA